MNKHKNAPAANRGENQKTLHRNYSLDPLNTVLERVQNVRVSGKSYRGDCPNEHRSRGNLSIFRRDDGTPWIECWSGCDKEEVLRGLGLEWKDLFWRQDYHRMTPQERREYSQKVQYSAMISALELVPPEMTIVACVGVDLSKGKLLNLADHKRLELAIDRVNTAIQCMKNMKAVLRGY